MIQGLGKFNTLKMVRRSPHGVYLSIEDSEVLLPNKYVPEDLKEGQEIDVFVYKDSEDRLVATTLEPYGVVDDYVALEMVAEAPFGAFLEWGLEKHLLVPSSEMAEQMVIGQKYVVKIMLDHKTERLIGVGKIEGFLENSPDNVNEGDAVRGMVYKKTDLGFKVIVDSQFIGLIYHNSIFEPLAIGQTLTCFIDKVRSDGKIDLRLKKGGIDSIDADARALLDFLKNNHGVTTLTDKSSPTEITETLGLSKKAFKRAVGNLYKQRLIELNPGNIKLFASPDAAASS
jgi:uncharacterized protein